MNFKQKRMIEIAYRCIHYGKYEYVKLVILKLLQTNPNSVEILTEISKMYSAMHNFGKAIIYAKKVFELEKSVETLELLANANNDVENFQDAAIMYEELLKYKKDDILYYLCKNAYKSFGLEEEGIRILEEGVKETNAAELLGALVFECLSLGMEDKADFWVEKLKKDYPNNSITENTLGFYFEAQKNDYDEAKKHFLRASKMGYFDAYYNLGVCCKQSEDFKNAEKYLKKLNSIKNYTGPDYYYTLGSIFMAQRKLKLGFKYYSHRKNKKIMNYREQRNYWDGKDYPNKIILIATEQGYGDNIQFSRFIPFVAKKFKKVYYAVHENLYDLMRRSFDKYDNIEIIKSGRHVHYNKFVMIMDIQNLLNISYHNIPHQDSYMITNPIKDENMKELFFNKSGLKIGLNWRAKGMGFRDAVYRTIDAPYYFKKLFDIKGNNYYSLQMNDIFGMQEKYPQMIDTVSAIRTFDDTASIIKNLDILITVDTAIAHLAGALGVKTYLLLCHAPDWRWFDNDKKTEWYPNVTIIKQHDRRTWEDVSEKLYEYILEDSSNLASK
jgi:tetratricopeptide (TPR) repeat protein